MARIISDTYEKGEKRIWDLDKDDLKQLFYKNFKPCSNWIQLSESFILERGFSETIINNLVTEGFIEKCDKDIYRMTYSALKDFMGENSWNWNNAWFGKNLFSVSSLEKQEIYNSINSLDLKDVPEKNDEYFHGFDYFCHISNEPFVFSANFPNNFDKDVDKEFAAFVNDKLLVKSCDYGCNTYPNGVTKDIEGLGEYTFQQPVWNFIDSVEQMFDCKCHFYEGYNGFEFVFEFGSDDNKGCYVLAAGNNGQEYTETLYLRNPKMIREPQIANTIISIDKALYTLLEEHSLKRKERPVSLDDVIKGAEEQKSEQKIDKELNVEPER